MKKLILKNRSYRRFYQDEKIDRETLIALVDLGRLSPTGANLQPLKFMISWKPAKNAAIFPHLRWAGYLKDWSGPEEGERPSGYVIILGDRRIKKAVSCDHGIAAQSILLGAVERGFGGCMIASVSREELNQLLQLPEHLEILLVIALGKPKEKIVIDRIGNDGDVKYWRDAEGNHHVPKRSIEDVLLE